MASPDLNLVTDLRAHVGEGRTVFADETACPPDVDLADVPTVTYDELDDRAARLAAGLLAAGLDPGARVGIAADNCVAFAETYLAVMRAGLVVVPVNVRQPADTIAWLADDADLALMVHDAANAHLAPPDRPAIELDTDTWAALHDHDPAPIQPVAADDVAVQMYTSGSTGRPKGVLLTHGGQRFSVDQYAGGVLPMEPDERLLVSAPMYHKNAQMNLKLSLRLGGAVVLLPRFDAEHYLRAAARHRASAMSGVPTMFWLLLARPDLLDELDLSSVQRLSIGSAPMTEAFHAAVSERFPDALVTNGYGTTEVVAVFGGHPAGRARPATSVGHPLAAVETRLVDPATGTDAAVDPDTGRAEGELWVRSPGVMAGYHQRPEVTAERLTDGWYHTGDVMARDTDGWHFFVGRVDDMFVSAGENVYPGDVEQLLERHPGVLQAAVVPVDDQLKGALPVAFVVPEPGHSPTEAEVRQWALDHGPAYQHPRAVWLVDQLPLAGTAKVDKSALTTEAASRFER